MLHFLSDSPPPRPPHPTLAPSSEALSDVSKTLPLALRHSQLGPRLIKLASKASKLIPSPSQLAPNSSKLALRPSRTASSPSQLAPSSFQLAQSSS